MAEPPATTLPRAAVGGPGGLLATKLFLPRPQPGFVARPRLHEELEEGLARGLILVCAPAGFGKTALLADWTRTGRRPVAWLSLDPGRPRRRRPPQTPPSGDAPAWAAFYCLDQTRTRAESHVAVGAGRPAHDPRGGRNESR
jgi:hypothetical protein